MLQKEKLKEFEKLLAELREDPRVKIVEGKRDRGALEQLGIKNIMELHGKPLQSVPGLAGSEAILLTDFDRKGRILAGRIAELFKGEGLPLDLKTRAEVRRLTGVTSIEELTTAYEKIKGE